MHAIPLHDHCIVGERAVHADPAVRSDLFRFFPRYARQEPSVDGLQLPSRECEKPIEIVLAFTPAEQDVFKSRIEDNQLLAILE